MARNKFQVREVATGRLAGWSEDSGTSLIKARWLADQFVQDYQVVRLSDGQPVYRCNAEKGEAA